MPHHHHKPFESLGPVNWADINPNSEEALPTLLTKTFADTQTLIESIPDLPSSKTTGRARSATEGAAGAPHHITTSHGPAGGDDATAAKIKKDWKDVKVNAKDNPMNISVWKMSAKDGKGAWFARRSVHKGMGFERWKEGLEREFEQTLGVEADNPDDQLEGKIRGIGAERRVEDVVVEGVARLQVYQLSVRFPGPTTPRDFVTLLVTSTPELQEDHKGKGRKPRQMVVISKPCIHPECPERNGFIRGQYESVEVIREVPVDKSMRKAHSSSDLGGDEFARPPVDGQAALNTAAKTAEANGDAGAKTSFERQANGAPSEEDEQEYAIEWLMITRSDPGGSVPRFMVEKGTPPGICNDASRFVKWLSSADFSKPAGSESARKEADGAASTATASTTDEKDMAAAPPQRKPTQTDPKLQPYLRSRPPE